MAQHNDSSRIHDLCGAIIGALALIILIGSPWLVDTSGPAPFYKGPLIFPLLVLGMMVLAAVPSTWRLIKPEAGRSWRLDGSGAPQKTAVILGFLIAFLAGLMVIGLEVSSLAFLIGSLYYLGHRKPTVLIIMPLIVVGLTVLIFKYALDVWFPTPMLMEWISG